MEVSLLGFLLGRTGVCMWWCNAIVVIGMAFVDHDFAWVDAYVACGYTHVHIFKVVLSFYRVLVPISRSFNSIALLGR